MKYKHRDELVEGLRAIADFIEEKGLELPIDTPYLALEKYIYQNYSSSRHPRTQRQELQRAAITLGRAEKEFEYNFTLTRNFGEFVKLRFSVPRETVCKRVVKGKRHIPAQTTEAYDEEIVEWICTDQIRVGVSKDE